MSEFYIVASFVAAATSAALAWNAWRRQSGTGNKALAALMTALALWALFAGLIELEPDLAGKLLLSRFRIMSVVAVPVCGLILALQYTGRERWLTPRFLVLLGVAPAFTIAAMLSDSSHHLFWESVGWKQTAMGPTVEFVPGPLFWAWVAFGYSATLVGLLLFMTFLWRSAGMFRRQTALIMLAISTPLFVNALHLLQLTPWPNLDITPLCFVITGLAITWAVFRHQISNVVPIARESVFNSMIDPVFVLDKANNIVEVNPVAAQVLGRPATDIIGSAASELFAPFPEILRHLNENPGDESPVNDAEIKLGPAQAPYYYDLRISPIKNAQGAIVGRYILLIDINDGRHAQHALELSEQVLKDATRIARLGHYRMDAVSHTYVDVSEEFAKIFGYSAEEFLAKFHHDEMGLSLVHPEDHAKVRAYAGENELDIYYRILRRDGAVRHVRETMALKLENSANKSDYWGILLDVTELKEAQLTAEKASRTKSEFLSRMSHELRTPLNAVLGFGELLATDTTLTATHNSHAEHIVDAGKHLLNLVDEVLNLEQVDSGRIQLFMEAVDPGEALKECCRMVEASAARRDITIENQVDPDSTPAVWTDRVRFRQVVLNLLSNAIKYNRQGGRVTIESTAVLTGQLRISISDTGLGIPDDHLKNLFEPFSRLGAELTDTEGTGIGLTITRQLVKLMGGNLGVETIQDQGSTFWFELGLDPGNRPAAKYLT